MCKNFLFSVDLEDVRLTLPNPYLYKNSVVKNTMQYLNWLDKNKFKCTFFTVGNIAQNHAELIQEIAHKGHEIACHTQNHIPLNKHTSSTFRKDLEENLNNLYKAGAKNITGFRAPVFSLTEETQWAYEILSDLKFTYSSSVLPAKNPLYGWESFGISPKRINGNIIEVPMTIARFGLLNIPYGGGVYFRALPNFIISLLSKKNEAVNNPLLGYFHPYDIDTEQERFMHAGINDSKFFNFLMYYNRSTVFDKLDHIVKKGFTITTYNNYVENINL